MFLIIYYLFKKNICLEFILKLRNYLHNLNTSMYIKHITYMYIMGIPTVLHKVYSIFKITPNK